ncbi:putative HNS binding protein [Escherichia phage vB_EcoP_PHB19]|uniref:Putative HNS binding protein n=1 Tax=Escherichia phage vB_EcoP_PHB19 TaxID=2698729 RepID=A0A6B9RGU6_9CAUD|nr:putative HNS binding protein [Escherichia phage vB_EcoP_PHB19]
MAMTKKFKVSFDVTAVVTSEGEQNLRDCVMRVAKEVAAGEQVDDFKKELLVQALTHGPDGLATFLIKQGLRSFVKDNYKDLSESERKLMRFSPATVREVF